MRYWIATAMLIVILTTTVFQMSLSSASEFRSDFTGLQRVDSPERADYDDDGVYHVFLPFVAAGSSPSRYYGYVTFTELSDPGLPIENLGTYTNLLLIYHRYDSSTGTHYPSAADLQRVSAAGLKLVLKIDNPIVEDTFDEAALRQLKNLLDPYKDVIYAIFVIDEPYKPKKIILISNYMIGFNR